MNVTSLDLENIGRLRREAGHLLVRRAIFRDDWVASLIFDLAAGDKENWTTREWNQILRDLKACRLRVTDWLDLNS